MTDKRDPASDLAFDMLTGGLSMGTAEQRVGNPADAEQVYGAYLSLLYAVRGARRGEEIPLRSADLDFLLVVVGEDPEQIERRLVELMGCTAEEATLLRRVLVRHRAVAASVGIAASLSLVALFGPSAATASSPGAASASSPSPSPSASAEPLEQPPLTSYLTTDDGEHVAVPEDWNEAPAESADAVVTPDAVPTASPVASPSPSPSPSASPAASDTPSSSPSVAPSVDSASTTYPARDSQVVLGEPMAPIDRPGWPPEDEVVLGEPMAPIDRPGWSPEDEVVLGEPMTPIDRPSWSPEDEVVLGEPMTPIDRV